MTGPGRLAADRDPRHRAGPVLRRHLLPARAAPRHAQLPHGAGGDRRLMADPAQRDRRGLGEDPGGARRPPGGSIPSDGAARRRRCSTAPSPRSEASADLSNGGFGGAPKFPPASALEFLLARGEREVATRTLDAHGLRRHQRPDRRRLRPLLGRRPLAGPPLREDALRQRPARPRLPARLPGARARALARGLRGDPGLDAGRDARPRGRVLLGARRRLGGRGGPLLRLDRATRRARCSAPPGIEACRCRSSPGGASAPRATSRARTCSTSRPDPRPIPPAGLARAREALARAALRRVRARGSTTSASAHGTRWRSPRSPTPARCSAATTTSTPPAPAPEFVLDEMRDDEGRLLRSWKEGRGQDRRLPRGPRLPARGAARPLRGDLRAALVRRGRGAGRRR